MLGLFAVLVAIVVMTVAMIVVAAPLLMLCRGGFLYGHPVAWWTVAAPLAIFSGWPVAGFIFRSDGDVLERGMFQFLCVMMLIILILEWLAGVMLLVHKPLVAHHPKFNISVCLVSIFVLGAVLSGTVWIARAPTQRRLAESHALDELDKAILAADQDEIRRWVPQVSDAAFRRKFGGSPHILAVKRGDLELFRLFWDLAPPPHPEYLVGDIIATDNQELMQELLQRSSAAPAVLQETLKHAVIAGREDLCQKMLDLKVDVNHAVGYSILMFAADNQRHAIAQSLIAQGADVNYVDKVATASSPSTALTCAVRRQDEIMCDILLSHGADPNLKSPRGISALEWARRAKRDDLVQRRPGVKSKQRVQP